jgi:hypothetical protein
MAGDNVLGSVSIIITGDTSRLQADFARAQALAITSGAEVSAAFNQSAAGADKVVVAIGKLAGIIQQESAAASLAAQRNLALAVSYQQAQVAATNTASGVRQVGQAHGGAITQIQAVSGALRTAFGEQSIRAVERFLTLIPGLGPLLQTAFPIIGALALFEMISRLTSKSDDLKKAQENLKTAVKETDDAYAHLVLTLDQLGAKQIGRDLGAASEARARAAVLRNEAADLQKQVIDKQTEINQLRIPRQGRGDIIEHPIGTFTGSLVKETETKVKAVQAQIDKLQTEIDGKLAEARDAVDQYGKLSAEQAGALATAQLSNKQKSLAAETDAFRRALNDQLVISHGAAQQRIAAISDADTHELRSAQEAVRAAAEKQDGITAIQQAELPKRIALINQEAAAEAAGKDAATRARIFEQSKGKVDAARVESKDLELNAAHETLVAVTDLETKKAEIIARQANAAALAWDDAFSQIRSAAKETADAVAKAAEVNAVARVRVIETGEKSTAETDELAIIQQKLRLEQQYDLQVVHTGAQRIAFATQVEAIEARARAAKIAGLNAELATAVANSKDVDADEKVATLRAEIAKLQAESDNADIQAQTRILGLIQRQSLEYKLRSAIVRAGQAVPDAIGGGLARGIVDGRGIGRDIKEELRGVGQQLLGSVFQSLIVKIGEEILAHTVLGAVFQAIAPPQIVATTANTAAIIANTTALSASTLKSAAGGIAGAAGGAGGAAASTASTVAGGLVGPLISAAGGIIGGVISAWATWVGDNKIVKAVNATTAAVLSLKVIAPGSTGVAGSTVPGGSTINPATGQQPGGGSVVSDITRKFLGSDNTAGGTPVRIVGIGQASAGGTAGLLEGLFGFGGGDALPVKIVSGGVLGQGGLGSILGKIAGSFLGFADGGRPPVNRPSWVGERGKELWWPDQAGTIIPAGKLPSFNGLNLSVPMPGLPPASAQTNPLIQPTPGGTGGGPTIHLNNAQFHGVQNVRQLMKEIATYAKTQSPSHSPYSSK